MDADQFPFLEVHHVEPLADGGPDTTTNAVAVCPNCHRALHYAQDAAERAERLYQKIDRLKPPQAVATQEEEERNLDEWFQHLWRRGVTANDIQHAPTRAGYEQWLDVTHDTPPDPGAPETPEREWISSLDPDVSPLQAMKFVWFPGDVQFQHAASFSFTLGGMAIDIEQFIALNQFDAEIADKLRAMKAGSYIELPARPDGYRWKPSWTHDVAIRYGPEIVRRVAL